MHGKHGKNQALETWRETKPEADKERAASGTRSSRINEKTQQKEKK